MNTRFYPQNQGEILDYRWFPIYNLPLGSNWDLLKYKLIEKVTKKELYLEYGISVKQNSKQLNNKSKLFSVPQCFQNDKFNLETAIKIIEYKSKLIKEEEKIKTDSSKDDIMTKINAATDIIDLKNIVQDIKNKKSLKKTSNE